MVILPDEQDPVKVDHQSCKQFAEHLEDELE